MSTKHIIAITFKETKSAHKMSFYELIEEDWQPQTKLIFPPFKYVASNDWLNHNTEQDKIAKQRWMRIQRSDRNQPMYYFNVSKVWGGRSDSQEIQHYLKKVFPDCANFKVAHLGWFMAWFNY